MIDGSGIILLDTNVLLRFFDPGHSHHALAVDAIADIKAANGLPVLAPQVLYEFWVVATRPKTVNGWDAGPDEVAVMITDTLRLGILLDDPPELFGKWLSLVEDHDVRGKPAHDARLAAAALVHGLDGILTFNDRDFARFGVAVQTP